MMARWHETLFPVLEELNIGYVAFSPLANWLFELPSTIRIQNLKRKQTIAVRAAVYRRGNRQGMPVCSSCPSNCKRQRSHARPNIPRMDAVQKAVYCTDSGHPKYRQACRKCWCGRCDAHERRSKKLDMALDALEMSEVFGGSRICKMK